MAYPEAWLKSKMESATGCSVFPLVVPEGASPPFVVYVRSGTERERTLNDYVGDPQGTFPVTIYADAYIQTKEIADQIRAAVVSFQGTESGVEIIEVALADESDETPEFFDGRDTPTYVLTQTYFIRWKD